ncbi:acid phosphatase PHO12 precursor [Phyllosticta citribraziliensis]|uniref:Acid phosphatase PHO12 n=1 Tax=Phyllosticta citribraziliensis TaxID=989973 RepID=A0ABR1M0M1_9PEZI
MRTTTTLVAIVAARGAAASFDVLQHLGGNGQWFEGPNVFGIDDAPPVGCEVDMAAFASRHGSRYPDKGAYAEWTALAKKIQEAKFSTVAPELQFLSTWKPVLTNPTLQIANLSATGYAELAAMGQHYRARYPDLFPSNDDSFTLWSNLYASSPRVLDSAKLFTRSYLSNTTVDGTIIVLNATAPEAVPGGDSLSPSDACPAFDDNGGGAALDEWEAVYLPPIVARINALLSSASSSSPSFSLFNTSDVKIFPYLCGFETQITQRRSPWCDVFTAAEILAYEYAQDLRYWYGHGPGNPVGNVTMAPFLLGLLRRFADGPDAVYDYYSSSSSSSGDDCSGESEGSLWRPNPLIAAFTNDGPTMQLAAATGVFDDQPPLSGASQALNRTFRASNVVPMRGTVEFERLTCSCESGASQDGVFVRVLFNGVVYPVAACQDGPGRSCEVDEYAELVRAKLENVGGWGEVCGLTGDDAAVTGEDGSEFLWREVSWGKDVSPSDAL